MRILKHKMREELAIRLLGWKWMSFVDVPVPLTPGYPAKCRVRQLFSKAQLADPGWIEFLKDRSGAEATGDEPLSYSYFSSGGMVAQLPRFTILVDEEGW